MTQSKITPEAVCRCTAHTLADQLKAIRETEMRLYERRIRMLQRSLDVDLVVTSEPDGLSWEKARQGKG